MRQRGKSAPASVESAAPMRDPRLEKLADVLVNYSVGVRPGNLVRISGPPIAQPLVVELYRRVVEAGGHPIVRMSPEELSEIFVKHASDEQRFECEKHPEALCAAVLHARLARLRCVNAGSTYVDHWVTSCEKGRISLRYQRGRPPSQCGNVVTGCVPVIKV